MAAQICPDCKHEGFTWIIDEERTPLTKWVCGNCGYVAYEDESLERSCKDCGAKTEITLEDDQRKYWWCNQCNKITLILD